MELSPYPDLFVNLCQIGAMAAFPFLFLSNFWLLAGGVIAVTLLLAQGVAIIRWFRVTDRERAAWKTAHDEWQKAEMLERLRPA